MQVCTCETVGCRGGREGHVRVGEKVDEEGSKKPPQGREEELWQGRERVGRER